MIIDPNEGCLAVTEDIRQPMIDGKLKCIEVPGGIGADTCPNASCFGGLFFLLSAGVYLLLFLLVSRDASTYSLARDLLFDISLGQNPRTGEVVLAAFICSLPLGVLGMKVTLWVRRARTKDTAFSATFGMVSGRLLLVASLIVLLSTPLVAAPEGGVVVFGYILQSVIWYLLNSVLFCLVLCFAVFANKERRLIILLGASAAGVVAIDIAALAASGFCVRTDHSCHSADAIARDDISICKAGLGYTAWCIWDYAVAHRDSSVCELHLDGDSKMHCFRKVALALADIEICKKIPAINRDNLLIYRKQCCAEVLKVNGGPYSLSAEHLRQCGVTVQSPT